MALAQQELDDARTALGSVKEKHEVLIKRLTEATKASNAAHDIQDGEFVKIITGNQRCTFIPGTFSCCFQIMIMPTTSSLLSYNLFYYNLFSCNIFSYNRTTTRLLNYNDSDWNVKVKRLFILTSCVPSLSSQLRPRRVKQSWRLPLQSEKQAGTNWRNYLTLTLCYDRRRKLALRLEVLLQRKLTGNLWRR